MFATVFLSLVFAFSQAKEKPIKGFSPIDYSKGELGKNFQGHDISKTVLALLEKAAPKKEFEKTVDYETRLAKLETEPLIGRMKATDTFIFLPPLSSNGFKKRYDADAEKFEGVISLFSLISLDNRFNNTSSVGVGIPYQVAQKNLASLGLISDKFSHEYYLSAPIPIKEAAQIKDRLTIAICFSFSSPYLNIKEKIGRYDVEFLGEIKNLLLIDPVTGHVYKTF